MSTFTLEQKRLEQLRRQLYGKQENLPTPKSVKKDVKTGEKETTKSSSHSTSNLPSENYIKKDLLKVLSLSIVALLFQFLIFAAITNNWLSLNRYGINF